LWNPPNNVYIDVRNHRCFVATSLLAEKVKCIEYTPVEPFFENPISSFEIGCYLVSEDSYRYARLSLDEVKSMRRGMKVDLEKMPSYSMGKKSVFLSVLHDEEDALY
jgi:hypothetical protein